MHESKKNSDQVAKQFGEELLSQELVTFDKIHVNVTQTLIITTEDKLNIWLSWLLATLRARKEWVAPLGLVLSLTLAIATANFKDFVVSSDTWKAIFIIGDVVSLGWLFYAIRNAIKAVDPAKAIEKLKSMSTPYE